MTKTSDTTFRNDSKMLSIRQLNRNIDSLEKISDSFNKRLNKEISSQLHYLNTADSNWKKNVVKKRQITSNKNFIPDSAEIIVYENALLIANSIKNTFQFTVSDMDNKKLETRFSRMEWHRKFSLSLSCLVLFFIGAPLGSIIRKGGLGMPLVMALLFFIIFHLLNIFGEKFAKEEVTSVFFGMWMSIFILVPIGFFLTYKAMHDSQLFNKEFYYRLYKQASNHILPFVNKLKKDR
jgi:lipopolysaccharide export system permease protein